MHLPWSGGAVMLAALLVVSGCVRGSVDDRGSSAQADQRVPLQVVRQQGRVLALVPISITGHEPVRFAVDTGASFSALDDDLADKLGLKRTGERVKVSGVVSGDRVPLVNVPSWRMGDVSLSRSKIAVIDLNSQQEGTGLQGLLGSDRLSDFGKVTIDYRSEQLLVPEK